jgi:hypothetical protein
MEVANSSGSQEVIDPMKVAHRPLNLFPIRSGRRGGEGFGCAWVVISGPVDDSVAVRIAGLILPRANSSPRVDRRTRRRVLVVRDEAEETLVPALVFKTSGR